MVMARYRGRLLLLAAVLAVLCGAPRHATVRAEAVGRLDGRMLRAIQEDAKTFSVWTHGRSSLNWRVAKALAAAEIEDPAAGMERALIRHLLETARAAGTREPLTSGGSKPHDLSRWARERGLTDLLVDVETLEWGLMWWSASVVYRASFRLIDPIAGGDLTEHHCDIKSAARAMAPVTTQNPFPQDAVSRFLLDEAAAPIKSKLRDLADICVERIKSQALDPITQEIP